MSEIDLSYEQAQEEHEASGGYLLRSGYGGRFIVLGDVSTADGYRDADLGRGVNIRNLSPAEWEVAGWDETRAEAQAVARRVETLNAKHARQTAEAAESVEGARRVLVSLGVQWARQRAPRFHRACRAFVDGRSSLASVREFASKGGHIDMIEASIQARTGDDYYFGDRA